MIFCPLDLVQCIRIFLQIGIRSQNVLDTIDLDLDPVSKNIVDPTDLDSDPQSDKAKMLRIQPFQILSTGAKDLNYIFLLLRSLLKLLLVWLDKIKHCLVKFQPKFL